MSGTPHSTINHWGRKGYVTFVTFGLGYATLSARNPRLIYCAISGFGQTGPRRTEAGYDAVVQAEGGLMSITGAPDGEPFRLGVAIADIVSGMFAAQGIAFALLARERSGKGQLVDVSMFRSGSSVRKCTSRRVESASD